MKHDSQNIGYKIPLQSKNTGLEFNSLRAYLNIRPPFPIDNSIHNAIDTYLINLRANEIPTNISDIPTVKDIFPSSKNPVSDHLSIWRGDITLLSADAIVNAANSGMLGCFNPLHNCIDNCIHTFAGPRLRDDCNKIMNFQGFEEPTGEAKITRGYLLPAHYVLHTVGPIWGEFDGQEPKLLSNCYKKCLDLASELPDIKTIAFCCISTGVFGYPNKLAAEHAIETVTNWLQDHPGRFERIIFNVFKKEDLDIYNDLLSK